MQKRSLVYIFIAIAMGIGLYAYAASANYNFHAKTYNEAKSSTNRLTYSMVHRKLGIGSTFVGVVKNFTITGDLDADKNEFKGAAVNFKVLNMDSGNSARDKEMRTNYINPQTSPDVSVKFSKILKLGSQTVPATLTILGAGHPVSVTANIADKGTSYQASGQSILSLKSLGIKPPQMLGGVISVDDKVVIGYQVAISK